MSKKINIKQEAIAPGGFKFFGNLLVFVGIGMVYLQTMTLINQQEWAALIFILIGLLLCAGGLVLITAHYRLEIDPLSKTYQQYVWLLGYSSGKTLAYKKIENISIDDQAKKNESKVQKKEFKAFITFDNGKKLLLDKHKKEDVLRKRILYYKKCLNA